MHKTSIKARLAVQVGHLYKRRNAERSLVHFTRRARQRSVSAMLQTLRKGPALRGSPRRAGTLL